MDVRCYYIALSLVIAGFGREFSSLKSRIQLVVDRATLKQPRQQELSMENKNSLPIIFTFARELSIYLALLFMPITAGATIILIEPDDHLEGTNPSRLSPYVTLTGIKEAGVYASQPQFDFPAPTGNLIFGSFPHMGKPRNNSSCYSRNSVETGTNNICHIGFGIFFHHPVTWVSLLAINSGYKIGLPVYWEAFDQSGDKIKYGSVSGDDPDNYGQTFYLEVQVPKITVLMVGGATEIFLCRQRKLTSQSAQRVRTLSQGA